MTRYTRGAWAVTASLPARPQVVRHARRIARTALEAWGAGESSYAAETVVSELVTNALLYGRGPVDLAIALTDEILRISVTDCGPALPLARSAGPDAQSGRGLQIVESLALSWEVLARPDGKTVSCVLPAVRSRPVAAPGGTAAAVVSHAVPEERG
ncbi:ATP-binding protein [Phaeacidiphilus oryzae]|uniref:ATP-binding protein n=1 Tax=Phaeacidiphilus oryzae TaxID=348818 RepID=UPI00068DBEF0|nr:ATP-binding protein [Phaeacidiphilus oryzae]